MNYVQYMTLKSIFVFEHSDVTFSPSCSVLVLIRVTVLIPALGQKMDSRTKSGSLWLIEV